MTNTWFDRDPERFHRREQSSKGTRCNGGHRRSCAPRPSRRLEANHGQMGNTAGVLLEGEDRLGYSGPAGAGPLRGGRCKTVSASDLSWRSIPSTTTTMTHRPWIELRGYCEVGGSWWISTPVRVGPHRSQPARKVLGKLSDCQVRL